MATNTRLSTEMDPQSPKRWQCGDPPEYQRSPKCDDSDGKPLEKVYKWMKEYDKGMCDAWRDEIEKLLIFAGLFAATVTAFVIDSYKWLQEDNAATSTKLLAQISLQLAAMANNSTQPAISLPDSSVFVPLSRSVRINTAWFLSLMMCLSTVILGILCLQWLREYTRESSLASFDAITVRQMRYEGLFYWKVPDLISFLPMALQVSVLLFFGGILDLLWSLHPAVAAVTTVAIGLVAATLVFTSIAPVIQSARYFYRPILHAAMKQCPYKSPFSWLFLRLAMFVDRHSFHISSFSIKGRLTSWDEVDVAWDEKQALVQEGKDVYNVQGLAKALAWTIKKLTPAGAQSDIIPEIFHSLHSALPRLISHKTLQTWATLIDYRDHKVVVALSLNEYDLRERRVQYDLLMTWFLQRHSFILNCDDLLMELRLRCLNALIDKGQMNEMFDEVLQDYTLTMASTNMEDANVGELRFQIMATILDYHKRHGGSSSRVILRHVDLIGQAVAEYIRCTPVNADNALMCYEIHKRFEGLLDDIRNSIQHLSTSTHDHTASINGQSEVHLYPLMAALLLGRLDLRKVEAWEENITRITSKRISVANQLILFLDQRVLPALEAQDTLVPFAMQVRRQLDAYHDVARLVTHSETEVNDGHGYNVWNEAPVP